MLADSMSYCRHRACPMADPTRPHHRRPARHPRPRQRHRLGVGHRRHRPPHHRRRGALAALRHPTRRRAPRLPRHPGLQRLHPYRHVQRQRPAVPALQNHRWLQILDPAVYQPRPRRLLGPLRFRPFDMFLATQCGPFQCRLSRRIERILRKIGSNWNRHQSRLVAGGNQPSPPATRPWRSRRRVPSRPEA